MMKLNCKVLKGKNGTKHYPTFEGAYTLTGVDGISLPQIRTGIECMNQLDALREAVRLGNEELMRNDMVGY